MEKRELDETLVMIQFGDIYNLNFRHMRYCIPLAMLYAISEFLHIVFLGII